MTFRRANRRSKYGNRRTMAHGREFHSKLEASCYEELLLRQVVGEIKDLQCQVPVPITVNGVTVCKWIVDFQFIEQDRIVWRDAKGRMTDVASLKIKLAKALYPDMTIEIWKGGRMN
jgi:hypothetical protein